MRRKKGQELKMKGVSQKWLMVIAERGIVSKNIAYETEMFSLVSVHSNL